MTEKIHHRVLWADYAKFIAIYFVVLGHSDLPCGNFRNFIYLFHLPLFFLISGYFDNSLKYTFKSFLIRNLKLLIVPYICFNILCIPFSWTSVYMHPELYPGIDSMEGYLLNPLCGIILGDDRVTSFSYLPCGPLWFLIALFIMKFCFYHLCKLEGIVKYRLLYWCILIVLFPILFMYIGKRMTIYSLDSTLLAIPFYIIGYLMKKISFPPIQFDSKFIELILSVGIIFYILLVGLDNGYVDINGGVYGYSLIMFYLNGVLASYLVLLLCTKLTKTIKLFQYIGANTIIILGVHLITIRMCKFFMVYVFDVPVESLTVFHSIAISIFALISCYPFIVWINKFTPWMIGK